MQAKTVSKKREKNEEIYSMVEEFSRGPKASPRARSFNKGFKQNTVYGAFQNMFLTVTN